jgi:hypothetical protein
MSEQLTLMTQSTKQPTGLELFNVAMQQAIAQGNAVEVVRELIRARAEQVEYEDRQQFNAALQRIQAQLKPIPKNGKNPQTNSRFGTAEDIDAQLEPLLQSEGMTLTFEPEPTGVPDMMRLVGVLSLGAYARRYPMDMPCDGQGPKGGGVMSRTHAMGSGVTLCKRYLKNAIFNLRFKEKEDDGNAAGGKQAGTIAEQRFVEVRDWILNAADRKELQRIYLGALKEAADIGDAAAIKAFNAAKDQRLKEVTE